MRIGVISDTHGLLRPEALAALRGVAHVVHAGDIGGSEVLSALAALAPLTAVRGNNDRGAWARALPASAVAAVGDVALYVLHDLADLDLEPAAGGFAAVISGHSHKPSSRTEGGVLYFNPGSAGPRRFTLPIALGILTVTRGAVRGEIVRLG